MLIYTSCHHNKLCTFARSLPTWNLDLWQLFLFVPLSVRFQLSRWRFSYVSVAVRMKTFVHQVITTTDSPCLTGRSNSMCYEPFFIWKQINRLRFKECIFMSSFIDILAVFGLCKVLFENWILEEYTDLLYLLRVQQKNATSDPYCINFSMIDDLTLSNFKWNLLIHDKIR